MPTTLSPTPKFLRRGKVRDIYEIDGDHLAIVTTDRLSAFDVVLPTPITGRGAVLTKLTRFWMKKFEGIVGNHLEESSKFKAQSSRPETPFESELRESLAIKSGFSAEQIDIVKKCEVIPVECIVRGFLAGSGWKDYGRTGEVCGHKLPAGMKQCGEFPEPLFTPSTKADEGHDQNISYEEAANLIGGETAAKLKEISLKIYTAAREHARARGIIIADTKFEFGLRDGEILLIDEVLTPDSSRFWPADSYAPGRDQPSFDKQIVRNYLETLDWNKEYPGPELPAEIVAKTRAAYEEILRRLTA